MKFYSILITLLISAQASADFYAPFDGSRTTGLIRDTTIFEYRDGALNPSNDYFIDTSGENLHLYRDDFTNWNQSGTCAVTADQWRNPIDGTLNADLLDNTGDVNGFRVRYDAPASASKHTGSVWVRVDIPHVITIILYESGVGTMDTLNFSATTQWRRISVSGYGTGAGAMGLWLYSGQAGVATGRAYFYGAHLVRNDIHYRDDMGVFLNPSVQTVPKIDLDLTPNQTFIETPSTLQGVDGNRVVALDVMGGYYYSHAHSDLMNIGDQDFTITLYATRDYIGGNQNGAISHGKWQEAGWYVFHDMATDQWRMVLNKAGVGKIIDGPTITVDGVYDTIQFVRSNDTATVYTNGVAGTPADVSTYGIDGSYTFYLGAFNVAASPLNGKITYARMDAEALSTDELAYQRDVINGVVANTGYAFPAWTFTRSTTAMAEFSVNTLGNVAVNVPRVAGDGGGVLIEEQNTQLHGFTEAFASWTQNGTCIVSSDSYVAPDGEQTADTLNNAGDNNGNRYVTTANLGDLTGKKYTSSVWVRASTPHKCTMKLHEDGVAVDTLTFWAIKDWKRISITRACAGGGAGTLTSRVYPGEAGVAVGSAHFWGGNITETPFMVSYIPNPGAATSQVTREADNLTFDPHITGTNKRVLPDTYCATCTARYLTVYLEAKCQWSGSADIGSANRWIFEVGGIVGTATWNRNRLLIGCTTGGRIQFLIYDNALTLHYGQTAIDVVDYSEWFSIRGFLDFTDLSRMDMWIDGDDSGMTFVSNSGTATFSTVDTQIGVGQSASVTTKSHCRIRNLHIYDKEVRP